MADPTVNRRKKRSRILLPVLVCALAAAILLMALVLRRGRRKVPAPEAGPQITDGLPDLQGAEGMELELDLEDCPAPGRTEPASEEASSAPRQKTDDAQSGHPDEKPEKSPSSGDGQPGGDAASSEQPGSAGENASQPAASADEGPESSEETENGPGYAAAFPGEGGVELELDIS